MVLSLFNTKQPTPKAAGGKSSKKLSPSGRHSSHGKNPEAAGKLQEKGGTMPAARRHESERRYVNDPEPPQARRHTLAERGSRKSESQQQPRGVEQVQRSRSRRMSLDEARLLDDKAEHTTPELGLGLAEAIASDNWDDATFVLPPSSFAPRVHQRKNSVPELGVVAELVARDDEQPVRHRRRNSAPDHKDLCTAPPADDVTNSSNPTPRRAPRGSRPLKARSMAEREAASVFDQEVVRMTSVAPQSARVPKGPAGCFTPEGRAHVTVDGLGTTVTLVPDFRLKVEGEWEEEEEMEDERCEIVLSLPSPVAASEKRLWKKHHESVELLNKEIQEVERRVPKRNPDVIDVTPSREQTPRESSGMKKDPSFPRCRGQVSQDVQVAKPKSKQAQKPAKASPLAMEEELCEMTPERESNSEPNPEDWKQSVTEMFVRKALNNCSEDVDPICIQGTQRKGAAGGYLAKVPMGGVEAEESDAGYSAEVELPRYRKMTKGRSKYLVSLDD